MVSAAEAYPLRWIVLLPLATALYHGLMLGIVRRPTPRWLVVALSGGAALGAFVATFASVLALIGLPRENALLLDDIATWIGSGFGSENLTAELALALDPLAAVLCLLATGVATLVHAHAAVYMARDTREDGGPQRLHAVLDLLLFALLMLLLADGLVLLFVGWQLVGVCAQLLVGFWYMETRHADRGLQVALVHRIGDAGLLAGFLVLFSAFASVGTPLMPLRELGAALPALAEVPFPLLGEASAPTLAAACIAVGVSARAGLLPFGIWQVRATTSPPPGAAWLHTAAGGLASIYLLCRLAPLLEAADAARVAIAWLGAATALVAAAAAAVQRELQRVIASAALAQVGLALAAAGCGAHAAAIFQLTSVTFGVALLVLCAGSLGLATHGETALAHLGGLWARLPVTHALCLVGVLAVAGVPPLSGFFSKQSVLAASVVSGLPGQVWLTRIALAAAGLCAFALWRMQCLAFYGRARLRGPRRDRVAEPNRWLARPSWIFAALAVLGGLVGLPQVWGDVLGVAGSNSLANFVEPAIGVVGPTPLDADAEYGLAGALLLSVLLGLALAHALFARRRDWLMRSAGGPDLAALGERTVAGPIGWLARALVARAIESRLIGGIVVGGVLAAVRGIGSAGLKHLQSGYVQGYVLVAVLGALAVVGLVAR